MLSSLPPPPPLSLSKILYSKPYNATLNHCSLATKTLAAANNSSTSCNVG